MFLEKTDVPHCDFSDFLLLWPWKIGQSRKSNQCFVMYQIYINVYLWKFGRNPTTGSQGIVQTRKIDADADANANANTDADASGISTKINMSLSY